MLPTDKIFEVGDIILATEDEYAPSFSRNAGTVRTPKGSLSICLTGGANSTHSNYMAQHLYLISDDEIKKGDWFYSISENKVSRASGSKEFMEIFNSTQDCKKVIASTDHELCLHHETYPGDISAVHVQLPGIPEQFIKAYVEAGGIDEVMVEYDLECTFCNEPYLINEGQYCNDANCKGEAISKLKLTDNNEVTICVLAKHLNPKEKMYSRDEVITKITEIYDKLMKEVGSDIEYLGGAHLLEEIENNLQYIYRIVRCQLATLFGRGFDPLHLHKFNYSTDKVALEDNSKLWNLFTTWG